MCLRMALAVLVALVLQPVAAHAQSSQEESGIAVGEGWEFEAGLYLFASAIDGEIGVRSFTSDVDVPFDKVLENLQMGAMGNVEARHGRWSLIGDGIYMRLEDDASRASRGGRLLATLEVEIEQTMLAGYGAYTLFEQTRNANTSEREFWIDAVAGMRYNRIAVDYDIAAAAFGLTTAADRSSITDWVDPVVGARIGYVPLRNWLVMAWGDIGGFGVGAEHTWQVMGTLGYRFENGVGLFGGYRAFAIDYEEGSGNSYLSYDLLYTGPVVGLSYRF